MLHSTQLATRPGWRTLRGVRGGMYFRFKHPTLHELGDRFPAGHPVVKRGRQDKPILARRQVWVERTSGRLWVIARITTRPDGKCAVRLHPYGYRATTHELVESTLRAQTRVWEDAVEAREATRLRMRFSTLYTLPLPAF